MEPVALLVEFVVVLVAVPEVELFMTKTATPPVDVESRSSPEIEISDEPLAEFDPDAVFVESIPETEFESLPEIEFKFPVVADTSESVVEFVPVDPD